MYVGEKRVHYHTHLHLILTFIIKFILFFKLIFSKFNQIKFVIILLFSTSYILFKFYKFMSYNSVFQPF